MLNCAGLAKSSELHFERPKKNRSQKRPVLTDLKLRRKLEEMQFNIFGHEKMHRTVLENQIGK